MSFNSPLNFSIKKSTPTTSTTNTILTNAKKGVEVPEAVVASNSVFLQNILSINDKLMPTKTLNLLLKSTVAPSIIEADDLTILTDSDKKHDLVDLFDRFDISSTVDEIQESVVSDEKSSLIGDEKSVESEVKQESTQSVSADKGSEMVEIIKIEVDNVNKPDIGESILNLEDNRSLETILTEDKTKDNEGIDENIDSQNAHTDTVTDAKGDPDLIEVQDSISTDSDTKKVTKQDTKTETPKQDVLLKEDESNKSVDLGSELLGFLKTDAKDSANLEETNDSDDVGELEQEPVPDRIESLENLEKDTDDTIKSESTAIPENPLTEGKSTQKEKQLPKELILEESNNSEPRFSEISNDLPNQEHHQQSHRPFDFQVFLTHLRKKSADPIVRYIRSFLVSMTRQGSSYTAEQRIKIVVEFKAFINEKFSIFEPFKSMDEIDLENSREGLEKLMMNRLYDQCFSSEVARQEGGSIPQTFAKDLKEDSRLYEQYEKYSWVNAQHLDIDLIGLSQESENDDINFIDFAIGEINKINDYRAPRDKIICILNLCKIIFGFLNHRKQETNADSFIPILIMIIIKAKTKNLISNLHYIESYRGEEWLNKGETSYYLSSVQAAVTFILELDQKNLTIDAKEYDAHMEAWEAEKKQKVLKEDTVLEQPQPKRGDTLSPSKVLLTSADLLSKSISNFLSPSPEVAERETAREPVVEAEPDHTELINKTYESLQEIFTELDKGIMKDIIILNSGDFEKSLDQCLELVNET